MPFPGFRLVEQTEQNIRRIRVCLEEKQKKEKRVIVIVGLFHNIKAPTENT